MKRRMQPAELAKLALALWGADLLVRKQRLLGRARHLLMPLVPVAALMAALVVLEPDLGSGVVHVWVRTAEAVGDGAAAFAFLSDDVPTDAIRCLLTEPGGALGDIDRGWFMVSLDHTVWFHEPVVPDRWHLHAFSCERVAGDRALTTGRVYREDGGHVATIAQEVLVRRRRDAPEPRPRVRR